MKPGDLVLLNTEIPIRIFSGIKTPDLHHLGELFPNTFAFVLEVPFKTLYSSKKFVKILTTTGLIGWVAARCIEIVQ